MKRLYFLSMGVAIASLSFGQQIADLPKVPKNQDKAVKMNRTAEWNTSSVGAAQKKPGKMKPEVAQRMQYYEEVIGVRAMIFKVTEVFKIVLLKRVRN
jgi:hypothetical protein